MRTARRRPRRDRHARPGRHRVARSRSGRRGSRPTGWSRRSVDQAGAMHVSLAGIGEDELAQPGPVRLDELAGQDRDAGEARARARLEDRRQERREAPRPVSSPRWCSSTMLGPRIERGLAQRLPARWSASIDRSMTSMTRFRPRRDRRRAREPGADSGSPAPAIGRPLPSRTSPRPSPVAASPHLRHGPSQILLVEECVDEAAQEAARPELEDAVPALMGIGRQRCLLGVMHGRMRRPPRAG